jgi:hypothetical protein
LNEDDLRAIVNGTRAVVLEREAVTRDRLAALEAKAAAAPVKGGSLAEDMLSAVDGLLRRTLAPLVKRIEELERAPFEYLGPHEAEKSYRRGEFVSHAGGMWHCEVTGVSHKPGDGPGWRLAVKAGRDAR